MRKPVSSHLGFDGRTMVVCDDGSTWRWDSQRETWEESGPIPGTIRTGEWVRTPVSSHVAAAGKRNMVPKREMVFCDDGSAWKWRAGDEEWRRFTPIPGTVDDTKSRRERGLGGHSLP